MAGFPPPSALWKYSLLLCDLQSIWWEMCLESYWDLFKCNESFLFFFFSRFSLSLSLDILVMCPSVGLFGLSYSELVELLRCLYSHHSPNLGTIQALFCQIICLTLSLTFLLLGLTQCICWSPWWWLTEPSDSVHFYFFSFLSLGLYDFSCLVFKFMDSSAHSNLP